ncbi:hypothetical protein B0H13DRAFT_1877996 [Mycena leptocephala]|nr:hypothetical protein B0H13DRAFT_1877996 [Mycena leptocephala]
MGRPRLVLRKFSRNTSVKLAPVEKRWCAFAGGKLWEEGSLSRSIMTLWSSVALEFPSDPSCGGLATLFGIDDMEPIPIVDNTTALVDLWFARSGGCPLSITFRCHNSGLRLPDGIVALVKARAAQWGRLELTVSRNDFVELNDVAAPFPLLQCLAIDVNDSRADELNWNKDLYIHAPRLTALRLGPPFSRTFPTTKDSSSTTLTVLEFWTREVAAVAELVRISELFPRLLYLVIRTVWPFWGDPPPDPPTTSTLPLKCLILHDSAHLLKYIAIPTLEHLGASMSWDTEDAMSIAAFLTRSGCVLTRLTLHDWTVIPDMLPILLPTTPWLLALEVAFQFSTKIDNMIAFLRREDIVPHLKTLRLTVHGGRQMYRPFLDILRTRKRLMRAELCLGFPKSPLSSHFWVPPPDHDVLASFEALAAQGMQITLKTPIYEWPQQPWDDLDRDYNVFNPDDPFPFFHL